MATLQEYTEAVLEEVGAIRTGHFVLTSGRHARIYVNKDALSMYPIKVTQLCYRIAANFFEAGVEVVAGPAVGAISLIQSTSRLLGKLTDEPVLAVYAEDSDSGKDFYRGFAPYIDGKRCLVVEDITTTGTSAKETVAAVREAGGEVVGLALLCNRDPERVTAESLGVPELFALAEIPLESWSRDECPLCKQGVPINTDIGKGREYLARKGQ